MIDLPSYLQLENVNNIGANRSTDEGQWLGTNGSAVVASDTTGPEFIYC